MFFKTFLMINKLFVVTLHCFYITMQCRISYTQSLCCRASTTACVKQHKASIASDQKSHQLASKSTKAYCICPRNMQFALRSAGQNSTHEHSLMRCYLCCWRTYDSKHACLWSLLANCFCTHMLQKLRYAPLQRHDGFADVGLLSTSSARPDASSVLRKAMCMHNLSDTEALKLPYAKST
jgi:hypothetical protein